MKGHWREKSVSKKRKPANCRTPHTTGATEAPAWVACVAWVAARSRLHERRAAARSGEHGDRSRLEDKLLSHCVDIF